MKCAAIVCRLELLDNAWKWFTNQTYVNAINLHGWAVYPITTYASLQYALEHCQCLISPGGYDVHGYYLQEENRKECTYYRTNMDHFDFDCIDAFAKKDKPILGICRGMQVLNLYYHGTLLSHIDTQLHAPKNMHSLHFSADSFLSQLYQEPFYVNSFHHQVIGKLGGEMKSAAYSEEMYVEAIVHKEKKILGVQWHPEQMNDDQVFTYFFDVLCA